jgi:alanine-synthesizing transaminase
VLPDGATSLSTVRRPLLTTGGADIAVDVLCETVRMRPIVQSRKLQHVRYDVRGPILVEAQRLEAEGHKILKLNIGNPAPFGFEAPEAIVADIVHNLPEAQGYSDSRGIYSARTAVAQYYQSHGLTDTAVDDVFIGNGVSELISLVLQAYLDDGNEILIPAPDYPLWTGAVTLCGGTPVHYRCDEDNGWDPDLADIESKITPNTKGLVIINPNNPTGAVYSEGTVKGLVDIARRHELVIFSDEIYEKILFDDAVHHHTASYVRDDVLCLTFSGLSKAYRVCGYRAGWVMVSGPKHLAEDFLEGLTLLANMRMCANVPAQHAIQTALGGYQSINEYIHPGGRFYEQSKTAAKLLNDIPGVSCVEPRGALYCFPRLDPAVYPIKDDEQFVIDLLRAKKILVTHGTGFNWFEPDHFRLVTLPDLDTLTEAIGRIADFLATQR